MSANKIGPTAPMNATAFGGTPLAGLILVATLVLAPAAGLSAQTATPSFKTIAHATQLRPGDVTKGTLAGSQPMHISVAVKLRNRDQLASVIAARRTLTPQEFAAQHAPTQIEAQTVANYLKLMGFTGIVIAPNRLLVSADGTADTAKAAFLTSFARVQTLEGRMAYATTRDVVIPAALQGSVLSVMGLQSVHQARSFGQRVLPTTHAQPFAVAGTSFIGHNPTEFPVIYSATGLPVASNVTVGIITVGDVNPTLVDLNLYTDANSLPRVTTQIVNNGVGEMGEGEWQLDSQTIIGAAGGRVAKIVFYSSPDWTWASLTAAFNRAVTANVAKIINVSIGGCELYTQGGEAAASDQVFQAAAAQGQTFSISTGDYGANACGSAGRGASWPASSPYVVAVSGTKLDATTTTWGSEVVWNWPGVGGWGATGGSPSAFEPKPSWQSIVPGGLRGVADVSFVGDPDSGANIIVNGGYQQWGGTSLSAPIFAGFWARVIASKGTAVGFAAPILYALPAADFRDVTMGNNDGYQAKAGYDFASGRGSLIMSSAITHIGGAPPAPPVQPVANFTYTTNKLIAKFNDTSSKAGGAIAKRAWKFGDGGTSQLANPSHAYLKAGVYQVTETVTDNAGLSAAKTMSVTISR